MDIENDILELVEPIAWLWIGTLLRVVIIGKTTRWVEWYFDTVTTDDDVSMIRKSQIKTEIPEKGGRARKYFVYDTVKSGRMFYLDEFTYHLKDKS